MHFVRHRGAGHAKALTTPSTSCRAHTGYHVIVNALHANVDRAVEN